MTTASAAPLAQVSFGAMPRDRVPSAVFRSPRSRAGLHRAALHPAALHPAALVCTAVLGLAAPGLAGCAGAAPQETERYPEKKRPEPLRSASDGEVMGANQQAPEDTLEGSLTTGHAAPKGPRAEAEEAHQRLEHEECEEANQKPVASADGTVAPPKKKKLCPPAPPAPSDD